MDTLLVNPNAGSIRKAGLTAEDLRDRLKLRGVDARPACCGSDKEMAEAAARAQGRVIVAGGDGTIHSVLKAAGECRVFTLAIIPGGTANHLADTLGIPEEIDAALDVIAAGHTRLIDLGKVDGTVFSQAAGAGLHARAFEAYGERRDKSLVDAASAAMAAFRGWTPPLMRVTIDGEPHVEQLTQVTAANTPTYGRGVVIAPHALLDDGYLDVVLVGRLTRLEVVQYGMAALQGTLGDLPKTYTTRARRIEIEAAEGEPVEIHADAMPAGRAPVVIEVLPKCLEVVAPREAR